MEALVLILGVLSAGLSAADPPTGLYTAEGVTYVGCFEHGRPQNEEVLNVVISADCTLAHPESCRTPATCIDSCQSTNPSYVYIGLKFPGQCFCDSALRGVDQTDSADGIHCDGRCPGDSQLACGTTSNMLVYRWSNIPPLTTSLVTDNTTVPGYTTRPEAVTTTTDRGDNQPQVNIGLIAGVTGGVAGLVVIAVAAVCAFRWRRKKTEDDKGTGTERTHYVNGQFLDDQQRSRTNQDVPEMNQPIPTPPPSSDVYLEPGVPIDNHEYTYIDNRDNTTPVTNMSCRPTLTTSNQSPCYVNQPPNHSYVNASETGVGRESLVYDDVMVPRRNGEEGGGRYMNVGYRNNQDEAYVNVAAPRRA